MKHLREHIKDRDNNRCFLCPCRQNLQVHHIKKRKGGHAYLLLITLCYNCHIHKVHRTLSSYKEYISIFLEYTSQFTEPEDWQDIIIYSIKEDKDRYKRSIQNKDLANDRTARKNYRKYLKLKFMEENGGKTPSQIAYIKQKEYYKKQKEEASESIEI